MKSKFLFNTIMIIIAIGVIATIVYFALGKYGIVLSIICFVFMTLIILKALEVIIDLLQSIDEKLNK